MGFLVVCVDAGVCTAGTCNVRFGLEDCGEGVLDELLDGEGVWLDLPAGVGGAVVG